MNKAPRRVKTFSKHKSRKQRRQEERRKDRTDKLKRQDECV